MKRRCPAALAVMIAAPFALAGWSLPARADTVENYTLTTTTGLSDPGPNAQDTTLSGPQVIASIIPPGGVVPPTVTNTDGSTSLGPPLTILPGSSGFDQSNLLVSLSPTDSSGQLLGLTFFNGGLAQNGVLHFSLDINSALTTPPELQVLSPTSGITITADPATTTTTTSTSTPTVHTPEPLSIALWSVAALGGAWRARRRR